jgi:small-conductance mechanosensitive channel
MNPLLQHIVDFPHNPTVLHMVDQIPGILGSLLVALILFLVGRGLTNVILSRVFKPLIAREQAANSPRASRLITLETLAKSVLLYTLYFVILFIIMTAFGIPVASLLATAGVAGVAIGFGAQKLVKDVMTGFFLLLEDQFAVGDLVSINGNLGIVEETGMRITKLRDDAGRLIILSNGDIGMVINYSKGGFKISFDVGVAAETSPETVKEALDGAAQRLAQEKGISIEPVLRGVMGMSGTNVTYRIEATAPPADRLDAEARLRAALLAELSERGVKLA